MACPFFEFGDIAFGNADIFLRADSDIARVEAVRGGSGVAAFASNSPGGRAVDLVFQAAEGRRRLCGHGHYPAQDYGEYRLDADYGGKLTESLRFHVVGGFYRVGEGPRRAGYDGEQGGRIKANLDQDVRQRLHPAELQVPR